MECSNWLNIIGLFLNIIGFLFILIYGLPTKYIDPRYAPSNGTNKPNFLNNVHQKFMENFNKTIRFKFSIGVILNIIGLVLQIIANIKF